MLLIKLIRDILNYTNFLIFFEIQERFYINRHEYLMDIKIAFQIGSEVSPFAMTPVLTLN